MTLAPTRLDELTHALEAYLALTGENPPTDPELWISAHELLEALKSAVPEEASCQRVQAAASASLSDLRGRLADLLHEQEIMAGIIAKNRAVAERMQTSLTDERGQSGEAWQSFTIARKLVTRQGAILQKNLGCEQLDKLITRNLEEMLISPTTAELVKTMLSLFDQAAALFDKTQRQALQLGELVAAIHERFSMLPGRPSRPPQPLPNLTAYQQQLQELTASANEFCRRPMNLMTDKASLVKKFGLEAVQPLRSLFIRLQMDIEQWLREPCNSLQDKLQDDRVRLEKREEDIARIRDYLVTVEARLADTEQELARLAPQEAATARIAEILGQP